MSLLSVPRRALILGCITVGLSAFGVACNTNGSAGGASSALARPNKDSIATPAPDSFKVAVETSKGNFTIMAHRDWAPRGVDRFYHLARLG